MSTFQKSTSLPDRDYAREDCKEAEDDVGVVALVVICPWSNADCGVRFHGLDCRGRHGSDSKVRDEVKSKGEKDMAIYVSLVRRSLWRPLNLPWKLGLSRALCIVDGVEPELTYSSCTDWLRHGRTG